jgi:hypothetical protein
MRFAYEEKPRRRVPVESSSRTLDRPAVKMGWRYLSCKHTYPVTSHVFPVSPKPFPIRGSPCLDWCYHCPPGERGLPRVFSRLTSQARLNLGDNRGGKSRGCARESYTFLGERMARIDRARSDRKAALLEFTAHMRHCAQCQLPKVVIL